MQPCLSGWRMRQMGSGPRWPLALGDEFDSFLCMTKPKHVDIDTFAQADTGQMSREEIEAWARAGWELAQRLAEQLEQEPQADLRPPSRVDRRKRDKTRAGNRRGK